MVTDSDCLADTNGSIAGLVVRFEFRNSVGLIGTRESSDGKAGMDYHYPADGVTALTVRLTDLYDVPLESMTMPVQFEVYTNTKLLWQVSYDNSSSEHMFTGRLLTLSGSAVGGRNVMICLNETNVVNCTTGSNGWFEFRRHFVAGESTIMYNV